MKRKADYRYAEITSFEDFRLEKEQLIFKSKAIEMKLSFTYHKMLNSISVVNIFYSVVKEVVIPKISGFLNGLFTKTDN